eukprot:5779149-Pyramimonas_sp.AAC.1
MFNKTLVQGRFCYTSSYSEPRSPRSTVDPKIGGTVGILGSRLLPEGLPNLSSQSGGRSNDLSSV